MHCHKADKEGDPNEGAMRALAESKCSNGKHNRRAEKEQEGFYLFSQRPRLRAIKTASMKFRAAVLKRRK